MSTFEVTTIIVSFLAVAISIFAAVYTIRSNQTLTSSDYKATERVKADTAKLLASFKSITNKAFVSLESRQDIDINYEKSIINEFLSSSSCFAYYAWTSENKNNKLEGELTWNIFFIYLVKVLAASKTREAARYIYKLEKLFDDLKEEDLHIIANYNSDLVKGISKNMVFRKNNPTLSVYAKSIENNNIATDGKNFINRLEFLVQKGIDDPNIYMFISISNGDSDALDAALDAGADPYTTDKQLIKQYSRELQDYSD